MTTEKNYRLYYVEGKWQIKEILAVGSTVTMARNLGKAYTTKAWALRWASTHIPHLYVTRYYNTLKRAVRANEIYRLEYGKCTLDAIPGGAGENGEYVFRIEFEHTRAKKPRLHRPQARKPKAAVQQPKQSGELTLADILIQDNN